MSSLVLAKLEGKKRLNEVAINFCFLSVCVWYWVQSTIQSDDDVTLTGDPLLPFTFTAKKKEKILSFIT